MAASPITTCTDPAKTVTSLAEQADALFGLHLSPEQIAQFEVYERELLAWNERVNLTAITAPEAVQARHFLDSLSIAQVIALRPGMRVIDIGSGAGFPGLPLQIAFPDLRVTLLESTGKKVTFLHHIIDTLGLTNARTLHARAEDAAHMPEERDAYDLVLARAVARLPSLLEYMLPFAALRGRCIAMKGVTASEEAHSAAHALTLLGGHLRGIERIELPNVEDEHNLVVVEKIERTPDAYPRRPGLPTQKPLV